jgi:hypothetical protein
MIRTLLVVLLLASATPSLAAEPASPRPANRLVQIDSRGVIRWQDNAQEVALFGVNYYTPCAIDYQELRRLNLPLEQVIDHDLTHFVRLGLDALRLHVFDREVSDHAGNLQENDHLRLLDYLIARAKARGIYTVLTPIAWWGVRQPSDGFSNDYTMPQMITDPAARKAQANYLAQFVRHVNPLTGMSYAEDPAVVAFELINEPLYAKETTDAEIVEYVDALVAAIRNTGCRKPLFYNGWQNRQNVIRDSKIDGCTFVWYPTGLVAGRSLRSDYLPRVDEHPTMRLEELQGKAKIVYEFDAADVPGSYLYPAIARSFRSGGCQIATQFQYDPLPVAYTNVNWQTHYLNLLCAPGKAISFMIASEAFHRLPRNENYGKYPENAQFGPFRVNHAQGLSELVTAHEFLYSNTTSTQPPHPEQLERIAGCGSSPIVGYEGTGPYFLDKLGEGAWRLEVYPDAVWVNDPYGHPSIDREVCRLIWREPTLEIRLPDLGHDFTAKTLNKGNDFQPKVRQQRMAVRPGVYLLTRAGVANPSPKMPDRLAALGLDEFVAPAPSEASPVVAHEPVARWPEGKSIPLEFTLVVPRDPDQVTLRLQAAGAQDRELSLQRKGPYRYGGEVPGSWVTPGVIRYWLAAQSGGKPLEFSLPKKDAKTPPAWQTTVVAHATPVPLFEAGRHPVRLDGSGVSGRRTRQVPGMTKDHRAIRVEVDGFGPPPSCVAFRSVVREELEPWREELAGRATLHLRARAGQPATRAVEIKIEERDGSVWGTNVPLAEGWKDIAIPLASLRFFKDSHGPATRGAKHDRLHPAEITTVTVCFGAWLFPQHAAERHALEIESLTVE